MLARGTGVVGVVAVALIVLYVRVLRRLPGDGPNEIAVALALAVLIAAHTIPAAGFPAALWVPFPEWHPDRWPRRVKVRIAVIAVVLVLAVIGWLFLPLSLPFQLAFLVGVPLVLGTRLASRRRGWIGFWILGSLVAAGLDVLAFLIARG